MIPAAGRHGGDGPAVARALGLDPATVLDLSASLNPAAPDVTVLATRHLSSLHHYPDHHDAARLLAEAVGVAPDRLVLTNGGSEAIALVAAELGGQVQAEPEFRLHPRGHGGPVWRSDPHNPTGLLAAPSDCADVWDEAFYPLATGRWSAQRPGIVVGSLTKVFACPGLRLGYILADDALRLARRQPNWPINALAAALLPELLDLTDLPAWHAGVVTARAQLVALLGRHGITTEPSDAPWVLARAPGLRDRLAPFGVVVRDCASFGLPDHVRIAVPDDSGLARLDHALQRAVPAEHASLVPRREAGATRPVELRAVVFDMGDTLVHAATQRRPVAELRAEPMGKAVHELRALASRYRLGAVTGTAVMTGADVSAALRGTGLDELLEVIVTSVDVGAAKPDPRGLRSAVALLGVVPEQTLFVGDSECDEAAAAAAGVHFARAGGGRSPGDAVRAFVTAGAGSLAGAAALVSLLDPDAEAAAREHHNRLTKPRGSLGQLEKIGIRLAAIAGVDPPPRPTPAAVAVFAGDHGVVAEGVTAWPQEVTAQMIATFVTGRAAITVRARQHGASVTVVDVGVAAELTAHADPRLVHSKVRRGTANLAREPAMTLGEAREALDVGAAVAAKLVADGAAALVTGDMGIGNTTPAAALIAAFTGRPPAEVTGSGAGIDDAAIHRKIAVIERGLARLRNSPGPLTVLAEVGGLEIAALAGFIIGGASHRVPVVVDGVIADAALLVANQLCPDAIAFTFAGHRSTEPGATAALEHLGLEPLLDLGLRLGEGSGAVLALPVLDSAALLLQQMATFDQAGVTAKQQ